jgi:hypothetical protein
MRDLPSAPFQLAFMACVAAIVLALVAIACAAGSVTITSPRDSGLVSGSIPVTAVCNSGGSPRTISSVRYRIDSGSWLAMSGPSGAVTGTYTATWNTSGSSNGTRTVSCRATLDNGTLVTSSLQVVVANPGSITMTVPSSNALRATMDSTATTDLVINVKTSLTWALTVQANHDLQMSSKTIPSQRLTFTSSNTGSGTGTTANTRFPTTTTASVWTGGRSTTSSGDTVTVRYYLWVNHDDSAGTYSATHTYVATGL